LLVLEIVLCVFFPVVLYIGLIDLFLILTFNIKFIRNEASQFFYLFFMNLSQSHDLDCEFNKLTWVGLGPFFWRLLIDFFFNFHPLILSWLKIDLLSMGLSQSLNPSHRFGNLTQVDSVYFFSPLFIFIF
jgi:hypothetical protein